MLWIANASWVHWCFVWNMGQDLSNLGGVCSADFFAWGGFIDILGMFPQLSRPISGQKIHFDQLWARLKHENTRLVAIGRSKALFLKNSVWLTMYRWLKRSWFHPGNILLSSLKNPQCLKTFFTSFTIFFQKFSIFLNSGSKFFYCWETKTKFILVILSRNVFFTQLEDVFLGFQGHFDPKKPCWSTPRGPWSTHVSNWSQLVARPVPFES